MARPKLNIDPMQVETLAQIGCKNTEIAAFFGCSVDTINRRFADNLIKGREKQKISLRRMQWQAAQSGNVAMMIWLGKQYLGQSDRTDITSAGEQIMPVKNPVAELAEMFARFDEQDRRILLGELEAKIDSKQTAIQLYKGNGESDEHC